MNLLDFNATIEILDLKRNVNINFVQLKLTNYLFDIFIIIKHIHQNKLTNESLLVLTIQKEEIFTNQILNESDTNKFDYNDYVNYKCSKNERTLLHLVCESGCFKFINECFNSLTFTQFETIEQIKTNDNKTSVQLAKDNQFENKLNIFKYFNKKKNDDQNNTILHQLVSNSKKTNSLRLILEYLDTNNLIDIIGFSLKNKQNKTAFDLAIDLNNHEAIYLLNHFEFNTTTNDNRSNYGNIETIENYLKLDNDNKTSNIRNLIFEGGGIKGLGWLIFFNICKNFTALNYICLFF